MSLDAEMPEGILKAVFQGEGGVLIEPRAIHRLQEEVGVIQSLEGFRAQALLGVDQLELVAAVDDHLGSGLGADADPVDSFRRFFCAVGLDGDLQALGMKRLDSRVVELQEGLSAGTDHQRVSIIPSGRGPFLRDSPGQFSGVLELSAARSVGADELGVAEGADRVGSIVFVP